MARPIEISCRLGLSPDCHEVYYMETGPGATECFWHYGWAHVDRGLKNGIFTVSEVACPPCYLQHQKNEARKEYDDIWV